MYLADTLPKNIVNLLGSTNVGIAKKKIVMRPTYKKMLKILPSKYPVGTIVNISYTNKKDNLIIKDVKVSSND